ncbi:hypothetical protein TVAG_470260 [Trichomonas vaginalis G3]|uniref:RING-type domain-containing protein n=1 Tax=Trichomonas vaginalis (strain ATCC PRA-98 / G3) TaxID=412133 RepID=A2FE33_TRIV3|nr:zinc finger, RING/FYVE/PHD-type domain-containing protein [Trichomonas vaginalis G3]EAX96861.1 hypothetical protein TVAG_470260 [Trichomonas vaginalis G3]KAI5520674.1 zinc finger, RING/FYVE/PHD-type domain-containing protein [Trichomonas vaginalis G3]|eukprot:XP_001309791.1 hypothetical protein [Trichomonas vaginalis G3]
MNTNVDAQTLLTRVIQSFHDSEKKSKTIAKEIIEKQKMEAEESENENDVLQNKCIFCKNLIESSELVSILPCCNALCHVKCIAKHNSNSCPSCKGRIPQDFKNLCNELTPYAD